MPIQVFGLETVEAQVVSEVGFETAGTLVELRADHGDSVKAGALLARLDSREQEARAAQTRAAVTDLARLVLGVTLGACAFAALGVLLAATASDTPPQVMMLSNLVRLPLMFVSGVLVPHADMPLWGQWFAPVSPLSYAADSIRVGFGGATYFGSMVDIAALLLFTAAFLAVAQLLHARERAKGA